MEGFFQDSFKQAVVTAPFMKSTLHFEHLKNYPSVSGFILKLVERIVAKQIKDHVRNNHLDNHYQSAYKVTTLQSLLHCS